MIIAERLSFLLKRENVSPKQLAARVGVTPQAITSMIRGEIQNPRKLPKIARELGTTADYLTGESDDPDAHAPEDHFDLEERTLVDYFRQLSEANRKLVVQLARSLSECAPGSVHTPKTGYKAG